MARAADTGLTPDELNVLQQSRLMVGGLTHEVAEHLLYSRRHGERFTLTYRHDATEGLSVGSLVLFDVEDGGLWLGFLRGKAAIATLDTRLSFDLVAPIAPHSLEDLLTIAQEGLPASFIRGQITQTAAFDRIARVAGERLLEVVARYEDNLVPLRRILAELDRPSSYTDARAMQQDALRLALKAFGADEADSISLAGTTALATVRLHEDAVIEHDARSVPGWVFAESDQTGRATFRRRDARLEVITANRRALERLFGVDLIYLNETRGSLVMVQYKMLENEGDGPWRVPIDDQFKSELDRMRRLDLDLDPDGPYRLHSGVFYLKFVRRRSSAQSAGILMSLGHFDQLLGSGAFDGPRGGLRLDYGDLAGHYLRGDGFVELVHSGYIGSRGATTEHLKSLVAAALDNDRAVVAAIQTTLR